MQNVTNNSHSTLASTIFSKSIANDAVMDTDQKDELMVDQPISFEPTFVITGETIKTLFKEYKKDGQCQFFLDARFIVTFYNQNDQSVAFEEEEG